MRRSTSVVLVLAAFVASSCGRGDDGPQAESNPRRGREVAGTLVVFAAASLTEPFESLASEFEARHDVEVELNVAGSQQLVAQLAQGAPADVLATADQESMESAAEKGLLQGTPRIFATNSLAIAVRPGAREKVDGVDDLDRDGLVVALAAPAVPVGRYTLDVLERAGVTVRPATEELSVKAVITKVALGEADAGVVYASDLRGIDGVKMVVIPEELNVEAEYPIARVARSRNRAAARAFIEFVTSETGRDELEAAGFGIR